MPQLIKREKNLKGEGHYLANENYAAGFPSDRPFGRSGMKSEDFSTTKLSYEYGYEVMKAIEYEWFGGNNGNFRFGARRSRFEELRKYALGIQDVQKYKDILCFEGAMEWQKLDWEPLKIVPKFVDIVVNGIMERLYTIAATAVDTEATNMRQKEKETIEADMIAKPFLQDMKAMGYDAFSMPEEQLPDSEEELEYYIETEFALPIEIAIEKTIQLILQYNDIEIISERVVRDIVEIGIGAVRHYLDPASGIKAKYVNPEHLIYSYTENPDFDGVFYYGVVEPITIAELKKMYGDNPHINWQDVKNSSSRFYNHINRIGGNTKNLDNYEVLVQTVAYQTTKELIFKRQNMKGGAFKLKQRDFTYQPNDRDRSRHHRVVGTVSTWMEGAMVLGTDVVLDWGEASNIIRPKGKLHKPLPTFVSFAPKVYDGYFDSLVARMIPAIDQFQQQHMKLQHLISRIAPDGVYFDADGLQNIDLGDGNAYTPKVAMRLYFETGSVVGRSKDESGLQSNPVPVQPNITGAQSDKINNIISSMNFYMMQMVDAIGANQQATNPDPDALLGVQKLAALNSNQATMHIRKGILNILKRLGTGVYNRLSDAWQYSEFKDFVIGGIGKMSYETLKSLDSLNLHDIGIAIELKPDAEEMANLLEDISLAIQSGQITVQDKIDVMAKTNYKDASQLLKLRIQKNQKKKMEEQQQTVQMNEESQIRISQAASQAKMEAAQLETQLKQALEQQKGQNKLAEIELLAQKKSELMEQEYYYKIGIADRQVQASKAKQDNMEDRKDKRENMKATNQSRQSFQRKNNLPPIDFTAEAEQSENAEGSPVDFESNFDHVESLRL